MNPVTISRRRFLRTYRHVAFTLQVLCCIATTATFVRILHDQQLPLIFLVLPSLLFFILSIDRCIPFNDRFIISIFIGAATGFISGFVSSVVVGTSEDRVHSTPKQTVMLMICMLEFLHLPVVCGVVMYSFCLIFSRPPRLTIIILSFAVATCGMVIINVGITMLYKQDDNDILGIGLAASVFVFLLIFFVALLPSVKSNKRAWIVCAAGFAISVYWQSGFFDALQWNWETSVFPIPGFLMGLVTIFLLEVADLRETEEKSRLRRHNEQLNDHIKKIEDFNMETVKSASSNNVTTALTWHSFSYIVERTSLTFIMEHRGHHDKRSSSDTWISCLAMFGVLAILTLERHLSLTVRLVILILSLCLYVCISVIHGHLVNGFFLDDVFGLAFLATAVTSDHIAL